VAFNRFFQDLSQTASQQNFTNLFGTTDISLPGVRDLSSLAEETTQIVKFVRYKLGEPVLYVELDNKQIYVAFEEANIKFSYLINTYQVRNWMANLYGLNKDFDVNDLTNKLPYNTYNFLKRQVANVGQESPLYVGGATEARKAFVVVDTTRQDYSLLDDFKDKNSGLTIREYISSVSGNTNSYNINLKTVFHYSPITLYRFYDPYSSVNLLSQEFNFESFQTETIFYVLPIWNDVLRAQQLNLNDKVRRSNISYYHIGDTLKIFPRPKTALALWIEYTVQINPFSPSGSMSADPSINGVSNLSNVPFTDINYQDINPMGRYWIRQTTFALCMEELGRIRRKFKSIPIPNGDVSLDGDELVREGLDRQEKLEAQLRADLEKLTNVELMRQETEQVDLMNRQLSQFPAGIYIF